MSLNGTNVEISVGGIPCEIRQHKLDSIECVTGKAEEPSKIGYQPGQPGMTQIQTDEDYEEYLVLASTFEVMNLNSSHPLSGWFRAPVTGRYRFYIACNHMCNL